MIFRSKNIHTLSPSSCQGSQQVRIILGDALFGLAQLLDAAARVQHSRVIATAEGFADLRQAVAGQFLRQRHRHLAGPRDRAAAALR